jgi:hypothetical protein
MAQQISDPTYNSRHQAYWGPPRRERSAPSVPRPHYLVVWEKIGSEWKLAADIWNGGK